ncbi:S-adenosylmethionine:tRNA ribosyltransferase-isomerase [Botrimarina colliarenosi]|uniref:S-adenosylmethionine:tRNA ribosyltransferase-isomerase n=1 Tax=Botrimarina colliarenosi TaxID=2528001 RepID=A0A5C6A7P1_9BACT|nr:tRNA preQ1(34) S-adenosylmethionine ribosyltransferase-isomerase QueA [Botrimarina colliarenosi]TWT96032.1 S-adenosylmethionine:tRNA ribosyltransferase-isomerase [Botrimarina colliarenosi]
MSESDPLLFDYELPRELIAQEPLANRADARLMLVDRQKQSITHWHVRDLPDFVGGGDRMVLNDTKVLPATLTGKRLKTGGAWRGLFLSAEPSGDWRIVCKTRGTLEPFEKVVLLDRENREAERLWLVEKLSEGQWVARPESGASVDEVLTRVGRVPLPHYIRDGKMVDDDIARYQTVFARKPGAVAAPTAGLHFTQSLLRQIEARGVEFTAVTLHVGLGTFRPIKADTSDGHQMHAEWGELLPSAADAINQTRATDGRIIAVGTTSVRTLETAAATAPAGQAVAPWSGDTTLFLRPPHQFRAVDALMTNFHFPRTTLLLLVQAFGGVELIRAAYREAIAERYRFYSYGDTMLIV